MVLYLYGWASLLLHPLQHNSAVCRALKASYQQPHPGPKQVGVPQLATILFSNKPKAAVNIRQCNPFPQKTQLKKSSYLQY